MHTLKRETDNFTTVMENFSISKNRWMLIKKLGHDRWEHPFFLILAVRSRTFMQVQQNAHDFVMGIKCST